jgi:hypothetical protein
MRVEAFHDPSRVVGLGERNYAVGVQVVERELERSTADPGGEAAPPQLLSELPADLQAALTEQLHVGQSTAPRELAIAAVVGGPSSPGRFARAL